MRAPLYYRPFNWRLDAPEVSRNEKRSWEVLWLLGFFVIGVLIMIPLAFSGSDEFLPECEMISTSLVGNRPETMQRRSIYRCEGGRLVDVLTDL
jgi:hypothetical protein